MKRFERSFTQQEAIPEAGIERAVALLRSGHLHRYGAGGALASEVALLESEFAAYLGVPYCLACASGGYALHVALKSVGVEPGDRVLCNAFTLAPVPGAIHNAGARPVLVDTADDYTPDLKHLERLADGADYLLLSHMRGHIGDMDAIVSICEAHGVVLIEDCAHTLGATWRGRKSGTFGRAACFSTQTYKHLNSGEGGLLTTADPDVIARAILYSGSYMLYGRHGAAPGEDAFRDVRLATPNYSGRMDELRAAILRPQLAALDEHCRRWNERYRLLEQGLRRIPGLTVPERPAHEGFVGSSIQFSLTGYSSSRIRRFVERCAEAGVEIKWFGDPEPRAYTSRYESWRYIEGAPELPGTQRVLDGLCDMRIPLTFDLDDCATIVEIVAEVADRVAAG
jgi:dTDP-4-amino-4,6-dideoxygalactose transaminase